MTGDTAFASITVSAAGATCGPKSATIEYIATGTGSDNAPLTRSTTLTVNWNVVNCQVSTSFSSVTASNSTYGGTTDLLAMVSPTGAAGSVNFYINGSSTAVAATYDPTTGRATVNNHVHGLNASATAYSVKAVFTAGPGFGDSEALSSSGLTVGKATPTVNVTGGTYTYDGAEHAASGSVVGVGNENLGTPSFTYNGSADAPVNAGSYTVVGSFAGNNNYAAASSSTSIEINRAEQVIEWSNPAAITYGTALSAAQLNASLTTGDGELSYSPAAGTFLDAGTRTLRADAAQTTNYNAAYAERQITVNKANPVITWNTPAAITYGTALNAAQLNASANVPGGFEYSVAANTVLSAGTHTLSVTFTPSDANNYNTATEQVQIVVNKANQVISWNTPAAITYGTTLSTVQLNASLTTGDGALTYSHNIGNMLNAGTHTLRVDAAGTDNYNPASKTVQLTVNKANATITVNGYSGVYDGSAHGATGSAKGVNNEDLSSLLNLGASFTNAPGGTASWTFNATSSDGNYNSTSGSVNIEINKAQAALTLGNLTHVWDGTAKAATATTSPAGLNVTFNYSNTSYNSATAPAAVGTYRVTATVNEQNYEGSTTGTLTISAWTFKGFYQPVDMSGVVNTVKAGSTVPMKWEVFKGSVEAKDVASIASTTYKAIACSTLTASEDAIEETTTSTAGLRFDTTGDQFIYNWKTPSTAGACYLFTMKTQDGSVLQANFKLK
ncbi:MAG TPA: PxKF domain-containing protein [Herpetosiphonaceae bacterium]